MACCKEPKYTQSELQRFTDRIENILSHDECRQEYRAFLRDIKRFDMIKVLDLWELANDIKKNETSSPERKRKSEILEEMVDDDPSFSGLFDTDADSDLNIVTAVNERASEKLEKTHRFYVHYLNKKYR